MDVELSGGVVASPRRRRRSAAERRRIVQETFVADSSVARVAQRHGVNANQVFQWRRMYQGGLLGGEPKQTLKLLPVRVMEEAVPAKTVEVEAAVAPAAAAIHIELRKGVRVSLKALSIRPWFARC